MQCILALGGFFALLSTASIIVILGTLTGKHVLQPCRMHLIDGERSFAHQDLAPARLSLDRSPSSYNSSHMPPTFQQCLGALGHHHPSPLRNKSKAPFAIVQTRDSVNVRKDFDLATSLTRCYARRHGGLFFTDVFNTDQYPNRHFFFSRWISLRDRYWDEAEWLLPVDGDAVPVGFHRSVMDILDNAKDADVILHARENYEIQAHMVIFRTDSVFARCFLDAWIEEGELGFMPNFDNGALLRLVLKLLAPDRVGRCDSMRSDYNKYTRCFAQIYRRLVAGQVPPLPIKVLFPLEGMTRCYEGDNSEGWSRFQWARSCLSNDIFVHGLKTIGEVFYDKDLYSCTGFPETPLLSKCYDAGIALDDMETLVVAQECCFWHYPGCWRHTELGNVNICRNQTHCQGTLGGETGMGICTQGYLTSLKR